MYQDAQQFENPLELDKTRTKDEQKQNLKTRTKKISQRLMQARYLMLQARQLRKKLLFMSHAITFDRRFEKHLFVSSKGPAREIQLDFMARSETEEFIAEPVPVKSVKWALDGLEKEDLTGTFVDAKAGRGQSLLIAAAKPFEKIIGVETSAAMRDDALMNIAQFPRSYMRCRQVECLNLEPHEIPVPDGRVVYLFQKPRHLGDFQKQINRITGEYKSNPRRITIITMAAAPQVEEIVLESGVFEHVSYSGIATLKHNLFSPHAIRAYKTFV